MSYHYHLAVETPSLDRGRRFARLGSGEVVGEAEVFSVNSSFYALFWRAVATTKYRTLSDEEPAGPVVDS